MSTHRPLGLPVQVIKLCGSTRDQASIIIKASDISAARKRENSSARKLLAAKVTGQPATANSEGIQTVAIGIMRRSWLHMSFACLGIVAWADTALADVDFGFLSARLSPEMTENQVINAIGYRPNKVELSTCGNQSPSGPWRCKIFTFGWPKSNIRVIFYEDQSKHIWHVNNWSVYP